MITGLTENGRLIYDGKGSDKYLADLSPEDLVKLNLSEEEKKALLASPFMLVVHEVFAECFKSHPEPEPLWHEILDKLETLLLISSGEHVR